MSKEDFVSYKTVLYLSLFCNSRNLFSTLSFIFNYIYYLLIYNYIYFHLFSKITIKNECKSILITLITNTKVEQMFSCMFKAKTDWRNRLANEGLNHNLKISEKGVSVSDYNPTEDLRKRYNEKVRHFKGVKLQKMT